MKVEMGVDWYQKESGEVVDELGSTVKGLSAQETQNRLKKYGPNELEEKKKKTAFMMPMNQFKDFMIIVLFISFGLMLSLAWVRLKAVDIALAEAAIGAGLTGLHKTSVTASCTCTMSNSDGLSMYDQRLCRLNLCAHVTAGNLN